MNMKADLKAEMQIHNFKRYYGTKRCCQRCDALQGPGTWHHRMRYKDMSSSAGYLETCICHEDYMAKFSPSPWSILSGWQLDNTMFDFMHMTYLGTSRGHIASTLKLLRVFGYQFQPDESDNSFLRKISHEMRACCKKHGPLAWKSSHVF